LEQSSYRSINGKNQHDSHYSGYIEDIEIVDEGLDYRASRKGPFPKISDPKLITQNPRISKCAVSQVDPESNRISSVKMGNSDVVRRVNSYNERVLSQFTPILKEDGVDRSKIRRSQTASGPGSIGVSRVVIENTSNENVEDFDLKEPLAIPVKTVSISKVEPAQHKVTNINYSALYKLAALIGVSVIGYCLYNDKDINQYIVQFTQNGISLLKQGIQNAIELINHYPTTFKLVLLASATLIVVFMLLAKRLKDLNSSNYNLIAENCIYRTERKIRENNIPYLDSKYEIEELSLAYDLTEQQFNANVYPLMKEILEDHASLEESNIYKDGFLKKVWKLK
jgi:hypothetical protein